MTMALPESVRYGYVEGRILLAIADRPTDPDRYPDGKPPENATVTFNPVLPILATSAPTATLVVKAPITCTLDAEGYLVDPTLEIGVWLVTGQYEVSFKIEGATPIPPYRIQVTHAYTEANPLNITTVMPDPGGPTPIPQWALLTQEEYDALPDHDAGTLYLIGDAA